MSNFAQAAIFGAQFPLNLFCPPAPATLLKTKTSLDPSEHIAYINPFYINAGRMDAFVNLNIGTFVDWLQIQNA
jgi:hypothetical protein